MQVNTLCTGGSCEGSPHTFWSPLRVPTSSPPSASLSPANNTLSSLSFCACGGEQTTVYIPAQMPPREQVVITRHCPFRYTPVQWNKLCRCSWGNTSQAAPLYHSSQLPLSLLPVELRGCDQDAGVGPIGSFPTFEMPSDRRLHTEQAPEIRDSPAETSTVSYHLTGRRRRLRRRRRLCRRRRRPMPESTRVGVISLAAGHPGGHRLTLETMVSKTPQ